MYHVSKVPVRCSKVQQGEDVMLTDGPAECLPDDDAFVGGNREAECFWMLENKS